MIQINELRVGNDIKWLAQERTPVSLDVLPHIAKYPEDYEGIPLTPEVLRGCGLGLAHPTDESGFSYWEHPKSWEWLSIKIAFHDEDRYAMVCYDCHSSYAVGKHLYYLHELQNAVWSFFGRELIYSPKPEEK